MSDQMFVLYDGRAAFGDTDDACVYCCADTLAEARRDRNEAFPDAVIYRYDLAPDGRTLINECLIEVAPEDRHA